jgi:hypothetical protein
MDIFPKDSEKSKLVQSITSIIQALPPEEEISPIEVHPDTFIYVYYHI